jgi:FMN phosphatase YigB (HAD superfamily)
MRTKRKDKSKHDDPVYVFDLDYTLYSKYNVNDKGNDDEFYNSFYEKQGMNQLLKSIKRKYIFTNGNSEHANDVIKRMNLGKLFPPNNVLSCDMVKDKNGEDSYKPDLHFYEAAIKKFNIQPNDKVYFFEDTKENLKTAKNIGWNTVFLTEEKIYTSKKPKYIDIVTKSVEEAIISTKALTLYCTKNSFD